MFYVLICRNWPTLQQKLYFHTTYKNLDEIGYLEQSGAYVKLFCKYARTIYYSTLKCLSIP